MARLSALPSRLAPLPPRIAVPAKTADPFYQSREWLALRARRMKDADYRAALGRAKEGERVILDHVLERRDRPDLELDPNNTQWLTMAEHQAKTAQARAKRARGGR